MAIQKITPHLWYAKDAEEAARFYASIFPDSRVDRVTTIPGASPSSAKLVEFTLFGTAFFAISGDPFEPFNHAISFNVRCGEQAELDRYWTSLLQGGQTERCGWLKDKFGVSWQIVPASLIDMIADPDRARATRVADALRKMVKLDFAALQAAYDGKKG